MIKDTHEAQNHAKQLEAQNHAIQLIEGLATTTGLGDVALDEIGCCSLMIDDQEITIGFDDMNLALFLEAPVMMVPASPSQDFYAWVLEDNFTSYSNGVGCLALDRDENRIVWLDRRTLRELDQKSFEEWLLRGVECAEFWVRQLHQRVNSAELAPAEPPLEDASGDEKVFRV